MKSKYSRKCFIYDQISCTVEFNSRELETQIYLLVSYDYMTISAASKLYTNKASVLCLLYVAVNSIDVLLPILHTFCVR